MKIKTAKIALIPLMATAAISLVGCNSSGGGSTPSSTSVSITVKTAFGAAMQTVLQNYANAYMAENKDVTITVDKVSGNYATVFSQTKSDINAGTNEWGDLVIAYPDHLVDYISLKRAVKLDDFIYNADYGFTTKELSDFTKAASDQFDIKYPRTGIFTLPFASSTECMFYNPVLLDLTIPGVNGGEKITEDYINNLTWEELFDNFCPRVLAYNASLPDEEKFLDVTGDYSVLCYDSDDNCFITLCEQYGYGYTSLDEDRNPSLDFNNDNVKALVKKFNQMKNQNYFITTGAYNDKNVGSNLFAKKKALLYVGSTGGITYINAEGFEPKCATIPHAEGGEKKMVSQGGSFCILSHDTADDAKRQETAFKFYKYMVSKNNNTIWAASTGYAPIVKSVVNTEDWADLIDESGKSGIELLTARNAKYSASVSDLLFTNEVFKGSSSARTYAGGLFTEVLNADTATCTDAWLNEKFATAVNNIKNDM